MTSAVVGEPRTQTFVLPAGPVRVVWQTQYPECDKKVDGWVVRLPRAYGYASWVARAGHNSKSGLNALGKAIRDAAELAKYIKRAVLIDAPEEQVRRALRGDLGCLTGLRVRYGKGPQPKCK